MEVEENYISSPVTENCENVPLIKPASYRNIFLATFSVQLFIMAMGMVSAYSSPACVDMVRPGSRLIDITTNEINWIASLPMLSGSFGNALSGYVSHKFGRKSVLMFVSTSFTASWLMIAYAPTVHFVFAGRILSGLSAGFSTVAVPAYVVEISTVNIRGFLTGSFQTAFATGVFLMTFLGIFLRWSWLAILGAVTVVTGACLLYFMPESPPWLIKNSRNVEAVKGMRFLKGKNYDVVGEFKEIVERLAEEPTDGASFRELLSPSLYKPLLVAFGLMFNLSFCGFPAIISYTVQVFQDAGSSVDPNIAATIVVAVQLISTIISSLLMDRAGRKVLYVTSGSGMTFCLVTLGTYTHFSQKYGAAQLSNWNWIPLLSFMIYIAAFSLGFGPMPYVVIPELVPTRSRSFVMAVGCFTGSFLGFVVTKSFDATKRAIGLSGLYWFYSIFTFLGFVSYWIFVPETKGRTIQDINDSFATSSRTEHIVE